MRLIDADVLYISPEEMNAKMAVACAPTITLKEYAKAEGYSIIKRKPMPKLKPCPRCGVGGRRIEQWICAFGIYYRCRECGIESKPAMTERKARDNWNETN